MGQGRESQGNVRGRIISFPKFKNKSKLTDCSDPERLINDDHQPATKIGGLYNYHI